VLGVALVGSVPLRRPLVGVIAEFLAPSHLGTLASVSVPGLSRFGRSPVVALETGPEAVSGPGDPDPEPERPWREDRRLMRAYSWLTVMWGATFLLRVAVQALLYQKNQVALLGTTSLILGLPVTAVAAAVTFWVIARLHRHRSAPAPA
jgi:hypothetical protein